MFTALAHSQTIFYIPTEQPKDKYPFELIQFLLKDQMHKYQFEAINEKQMALSRQISEIHSGSLSFAAIATNDELERELRPIRLPILKGLLGHRVFIIKEGDQHRFTQISSLEQLKFFKAGQGRFWGSTPILEHAGMPMVKPPKYNSLFNMLEGGRFDYFPRAVHEPYSEIELRPDLSLTVESNLMLVYPLPMYLFTAQGNEAFAHDLEVAFEAAISDGSFDRWFYNHPLIQDALTRIDLQQRTIIQIDNPFLPKSTPLDRKELWLETHGNT
nr:diguanylate cyclase [Echinimonas agarilytica]